MFCLIAKSGKLPKRCRIVGDRLLTQLGRCKLKRAPQNDVSHSEKLYNHLALMEGLCPDLPLLLEAVNNILVAPTNFVREALSLDEPSSTWTSLPTHLYCAVFPPWLQSKNPQSLWYYHSLLPIIRRPD